MYKQQTKLLTPFSLAVIMTAIFSAMFFANIVASHAVNMDNLSKAARSIADEMTDKHSIYGNAKYAEFSRNQKCKPPEGNCANYVSWVIKRYGTKYLGKKGYYMDSDKQVWFSGDAIKGSGATQFKNAIKKSRITKIDCTGKEKASSLLKRGVLKKGDIISISDYKGQSGHHTQIYKNGSGNNMSFFNGGKGSTKTGKSGSRHVKERMVDYDRKHSAGTWHDYYVDVIYRL